MSQSPRNQNYRSFSREGEARYRKSSSSSSRSNSHKKPQRRYTRSRSFSKSQSKMSKDRYRQNNYDNRFRDRDSHFGKPYQNDRFDNRGGYDKYQQNKEKSQLKLLTMRRYREENESLIRVHFFIKNCYMEGGNAENFLFETKKQIQKCGYIDIIQLYNCSPKDNITDIAVGMRMDEDAQKIVEGNRMINLKNKNGEYKNQYPNLKMSSIFEKQLKEQYEKSKKKKSHGAASRSRSRSQTKKKSKSYRRQQQYYDQRIMIFGIPYQIQQNDIKNILAKRDIVPVSMEWKDHEGMEYLLCQFETKEQYENIMKKPLILDYQYEIEGQMVNLEIPVLIIKEVSEKNILSQLGLHQVRLNYDKESIVPLFVYKIFSQQGTIVNLFQDEQHKFLQIIYAEDVTSLVNLKIPSSLNIVVDENVNMVQLQIEYPNCFEQIKRLEINKSLNYQIKRAQQSSNPQNLQQNQQQQIEQQAQQDQNQASASKQQENQQQQQQQIQNKQASQPQYNLYQQEQQNQPKSPSQEQLQQSGKKSSSRSQSYDTNGNSGVQIMTENQQKYSQEREDRDQDSKSDNFNRNQERYNNTNNRDRSQYNNNYNKGNQNYRGNYQNRGQGDYRRGGNDFGGGRSNRGQYGNSYQNNRGSYQDRRDSSGYNNRGNYDNRNRSYNNRFSNNYNRR
ncbi:hypothetical protein PPERSA_07440 [Pseudocohnilembus persalinus]|uniref:Uncharacterized protein n=1 Tax=Pseudocohnilembus persalinus TaxID=266149 RepID=A0A0V0QAD4_PSEPJ|nr:hypothetical protein PPERSA_07440 [Pseudocohnilembus persalinus]|eukprot:KRW99197.1 hypothetical protein PPERSA_07440 [Pseudocohnilembus persalinus]